MPGVQLSLGECCLPEAEGITYLRIGARGRLVGMMDLEKVFEQLFLMERRPEEASDEELVGMARRFNYIPARASIEAEYAEALRQAYMAYWAKRELR